MAILPDRTTLAGHPALRVGEGPDTLLVIPGLNDPLLRVTERRWFDAAMGVFMRRFANGRTVYLASRPANQGTETTVADLAAGYRRVLDEVGAASVVGLSLGGFVGLELAARDERVERLVLALAAHRLNPAGSRLVREWRDAAAAGQWRDVYRGAADVLGTGWRRHAYRLVGDGYALLTRTPTAADDFVPTADACLDYDGRETLGDVAAPTLVVGGTRDPFFAGMDFATTASGVADGRLVELDGAGHEAVIERPRFTEEVRRFLD